MNPVGPEVVAPAGNEREDEYNSRSEQRRSGSEAAGVDLTPAMREELLNPAEWNAVLATYAGTMGLAVALTDCEGRELGICHNPQPAWLVAKRVKPEHEDGSACPFCLHGLAQPCEAVKTALSAGSVQLVQDGAGLVHLAIPLLLGTHKLGALIAGQVFDQYPDALLLQRVAKQMGVPQERFCQQARLQKPIRNATLRIYGDLLFSLGKAFVRQRYAAILDRRLERSNLRLRLSVDGIKNHALFTVDSMGVVTSWNLGSHRLFGYPKSEIVGQHYSRFFTPEDIQSGAPGALLEKASEDGFASDEAWQVRKDGTHFLSEGSLSVLGVGGAREFGRLTHDVTEYRAAEEALRQSQKMESIGVLSSGIAHDFNNLLAGILGGVSFAMSKLKPEDAAYPSLAIAQTTAQNAAGLTRQLLAYAGQGKFVVERLDLSLLIQEMLQLLHASIPKSVKLELALEPDLPWIEADASQIQQVVMNLVINGVEAIGPEGGSLWVSTRVEHAVEGTEPHVCLEVKDSGAGMSEETKARIFDPFFTTKLMGRGLGLAAVTGIVRGHSGTMKVQSQLGKGTTFSLCFPAVEKGVPKEEIAPAVQVAASAGGTILVVDDEPVLCMLAKLVLEHVGYCVLTAEDGREAVEMFRQHADTITAVLLDMTMPVMSGDKAFALIREIRADVPVVVSTGYGESMTRAVFKSGVVVGFIQKPYTADQLRGAIQQACTRRPAVSGAGR